MCACFEVFRRHTRFSRSFADYKVITDRYSCCCWKCSCSEFEIKQDHIFLLSYMLRRIFHICEYFVCAFRSCTDSLWLESLTWFTPFTQVYYFFLISLFLTAVQKWIIFPPLLFCCCCCACCADETPRGSFFFFLIFFEKTRTWWFESATLVSTCAAAPPQLSPLMVCKRCSPGGTKPRTLVALTRLQPIFSPLSSSSSGSPLLPPPI